MTNNVGSTGSGTSGTNSIDYLGSISSLSGLPFDPTTVINALVAVQQEPVTNLQTQIKNIQTNESIYKSIGSDVASLQSVAFNLTLQSYTQAKTATSSNANAVTATASPLTQAGTYNVTVNTLATATTATSTAAIGQSIDSVASTTPLSGLNLGTPVTGGTFSIVVDGKVQTVNVDTTKPLLDAPGTNPPQGVLSQLQAAISAGINDPSATVSVGVANDKVSISISGATSDHTLSLGAAGDTSNFLQAFSLSTGQGSTPSGSLSIQSTANAGVALTTNPLSSASLGQSLSAGSGSFTINGASISWDSTTDSLSDVLNRINSSTAGVVAQYNATTDQVTLANKATGQTAISLADTSGNLLAALNLAPGTSSAQTLGSNASVTVNNTTIYSTSNTITSAVPGLSITALQQGQTAALTVGTDTSTITKNVQSLVDSANKVLSDIYMTQQKDATSGTYSQLLGDPTLTGIRDSVINMVTGIVTNSGAYQSLQDIGITMPSTSTTSTTGPQFVLDTSKLSAALAAAPDQVAALFNGTTSVNGFQGAAQQLNTYLEAESNPITSPFAEYQTTGDSEIALFNTQITQLNNQIAQQKQVLTSQFSAMATALSSLSAQSSALSSIITNSSSSTSSSSSSSTGA